MLAKYKIIIAVVAVVVCLVAASVTIVVTMKPDNDGHINVDDPPAMQGELDLVLKREKLTSVTLDKTGLAHLSENETERDFSSSSENIFGISGDLLIGPKCFFEADMAISNKKPHAFEYWLEIVPENGEALLAEQLMLTVNGKKVVERTLAGGLKTETIAAVASGEISRFSVRLEYLDVQNNDETKNSTLAFDMIVHAKLTAQKEGA